MNNGQRQLVQIQANPRTGTKPEEHSSGPRHGRYNVVSADGRSYLYIPQIQRLFALREELASALRAAETEPDSELERAATVIVSDLISKEAQGPLSENRHAHLGLRDVVVHVSQICNLNCVYCYAVDLNKAGEVMRPATADKVVSHTMELAHDGLSSVKFLGGEPTLAWAIVERIMDRYMLMSSEARVKSPRFTMVTNGTKMTPAMIESAVVHRMHVMVSIDGPGEIHDRLRPTHGGSGSYSRAIETLKALICADVDVAVEAVYTRQHYLAGLTPQMMVEHFLSLGIREIQIAPTVGVWHDCDTIEQVEEIASLFEEASRECIRSFRTASPHLLRGIQFVLDGFALRERRRHVCGAGRTFIAINYDGEAFPCYLLESSDTSYGVIGRDWSQERYELIKSRFVQNAKDHHPVCRECWANEICQSCLGTSWLIKPEITKPPAWFCGLQKKFIAAVLAEIASARESRDWTVFLQNMRRHLEPLGAR